MGYDSPLLQRSVSSKDPSLCGCLSRTQLIHLPPHEQEQEADPKEITSRPYKLLSWIDAFELLWTSDSRISLATQPVLKIFCKQPSLSRSLEALRQKRRAGTPVSRDVFSITDLHKV